MYMKYMFFSPNDLCISLPKYSVKGYHSDYLMHYTKKLVAVSINTTHYIFLYHISH